MAALAAMTLAGTETPVATTPANPATPCEAGTRPIPERKALRCECSAPAQARATGAQ